MQEAASGIPALAPQQRQIADLLREGCTVEEIAYRLKRSSSTVSTQIRHIRAKLGARSTMHAAVLWERVCSRADIEYESWGRPPA